MQSVKELYNQLFSAQEEKEVVDSDSTIGVDSDDSAPSSENKTPEIKISEIVIPKEYSQEEKEFTERALTMLLKIYHKVELITDKIDSTRQLYPMVNDFRKGVQDWVNNSEHGPKHSLAVFKKEKEIREIEVTAGRLTDDPDLIFELEIRAMLHDLGEFLLIRKSPITTQEENSEKAWASKKHDRVISLVIRKIAKLLGVKDAHQLALDVKFHDAYWRRLTIEQMNAMFKRLSAAGRILWDADRLVGDDALTAIARNRSNSKGKWYVLRDLTVFDRKLWQVRTGGFFDGMCALLTEFTGEDYWFFSDIGKKLNKKKKEEFKTALPSFYQNEYVKDWEVLKDALKNGQEIKVGIKGKTEEIIENAELKINKDMNEDQIRLVLEKMVNTPVSGKTDDKFPDREYFGYSLKVGDDWLDPSILRFKSADELTNALNEVVEAYTCDSQ